MKIIWKYLIKLYIWITNNPYNLPKIFFHKPKSNPALECFILTLHADISFTSKERKIIFDAITDMEFFLNYQYIFNLKFDLTEETYDSCSEEHIMVRAEEDFPNILEFEKENQMTIIGLCQSWSNKTNDIYLLHNRLNNFNYCYDMWKVTILHELGHLLGMMHTDDGIMHPTISGNILYPNYDDALAYSKVHQCNPKDLQYFKG